MTIIYTQGDILKDISQAIVIPVNTVGVPGAGLAQAWAKRDPDAAKLYKALCKLERIKIGEVATITTADSQWILFPTKEHWKDPSKIEWIEDGLVHLCQMIKDLQLKSIAIPALGCGLGGLDWEDVKPLMQAYLLQIRIPITIYLPQ
jgi:O-acetyl-ADP-ribose deacetylase (regulator of RNase III)